MLRPSKLCAIAPVVATLAALTASLAGAQDLRVRLVDQETHQPLAGVLVSALNSGGAASPSVLSSGDGIATVHIQGTGAHRLLVRRIGFAPVTTDPLDLPAESAKPLDIVVPAHRITLATVHVLVNSSCQAQTPSPSASAEPAWTEVLTALEASALTRDQRLVTTTAYHFQRTLRTDWTADGVDIAPLGQSGERPFFAPSPAVLERNGYFKQHDDGSEDFFAPDEHVLLSPGFTRQHCIGVFPDVRHDSTGTQIALAFVPRERDSRPEIRGLIWIDSASSELRRIEFGYVRLSLPAQADSLGGSVEFTHLVSGAWIISAWTLRLPRWSTPRNALVRIRARTILDGYSEVGGKASVVQEIATPGAMVPRSIVGLVYDSVAGRPLSGAHVHIADLGRDAIADSMGAFRFDSVSAGVHSVWADHPSLDALGLFTIAARADATPRAVNDITLAIPSFATLWRSACNSEPPRAGNDAGFVFGRVISDAPQARRSRTSIELSWRPAQPDGVPRGGAQTRRTVRPDSTGSYAICGVPLDQRMTLSASAGDTISTPVSFRVGWARIARHDITLPSNAAIDELVADSAGIAPLVSPDGSTVAGVVRDSAGQPVGNARVTVSGVSHEWRTDVLGGFAARGIPRGTRVVAISALGYLPERRLVDVTQQDSAYVDVAVTHLITRLSTVTVKERARYSAIKAELDSRRVAGFGYFVDSTALIKYADLSQSLTFPRVSVVYDRGRWYIVMRSGVLTMLQKDGTGGLPTCTPTIWIDGSLSDIDILNDVRKEEVGLVEVYTSAAEAGLDYTGTRSNCGVVLVWRKRFISP